MPARLHGRTRPRAHARRAPACPTAGVQKDQLPYLCLDLSLCHQLLSKGFKLGDQRPLMLVRGDRGAWRPRVRSAAHRTAAHPPARCPPPAHLRAAAIGLPYPQIKQIEYNGQNIEASWALGAAVHELSSAAQAA